MKKPSADKEKSTTTRKRNRSVKSQGLGRTPMGACSTVKTLMYHMTGVGPVVTMTAKLDLVLAAKTIDHRNGEILADAPVRVPAGTVLYFIASTTHLGWFYVVRVPSAEHIFCSCPAAQNRLHCEHTDLALVAYKARQARANRQTTDEIVSVSSQLEDKTLSECAHEMPTARPEEQELAKQPKSYAEQLQEAKTPEEKRAIWKRVRQDEIARNKQATAEYWAKVHELRAKTA